MARYSLQEIRTMVEEYREQAIDLLRKVIQTPSPTGQELEISKLFARHMEDMGLEVDRYEYEKGRPNLLAEWIGNPDGKKFIFNGHMDVFPPTEGIEGKFGPWSGEIEDGRIYGRGATDMKSGDCAALMAVRILREKGYTPNGKILLSYMVDEENNSRKGSLSLLENGLLKDGDFGICMEPSDYKILMEEGGVWQIEVTYLSSGGHTTNPNTEEDAIKKAVRAINELYKLQATVESRQFANLGHPFLNIGVINGGTVSNVRATKATFSVDRRFAADEGFENVKKEILDILDALKEKDPTYDYSLKEIAYYPSAKRDGNNEYIQKIIQACAEFRGGKIEQFGRYGSSDSVFLIDQSNIQMPIYGPGICDVCGTEYEYVEIDDYLISIMTYIRAIDLLLGEKKTA